MHDDGRQLEIVGDVPETPDGAPSWEPWASPLVFTRERGKPTVSFPLPLSYRSGRGIEWGYSGSGPSQLALEMAAMVFPLRGSLMQPFGRGKYRVSRLAWQAHYAIHDQITSRIPANAWYIGQRDFRRWSLIWALQENEPAQDPAHTHDALRAQMVRTLLTDGVRFRCPYCGTAWRVRDTHDNLDARLACQVAEHCLAESCATPCIVI
jgi:uncharacterized protein DUF6166